MPTREETLTRDELAALEINGQRPSLAAAIRTTVEDAYAASPVRPHQPAGFNEPIRYTPVLTIRSLTASLAGDGMPNLFDKDGKLKRVPNAAPSTGAVKMQAVVIANSRAAMAGAAVVILPEAAILRPVGQNGVIGTERIPGFFRNVNPAAWVTVADGDTLPESAFPIETANINIDDGVVKAVRLKFTRRQRLNYVEQEGLINQLVASITLGLARAADEVLFSELGSRSLAPFAIAEAAAQGLSFGELRAIVGTNANGAVIDSAGALRAGGIPAELTAETAETFVGDFSRAAVAIRDDVIIRAERTGLAGEMTLYAWASMQPLIPDDSKFWVIE